MGHSAPQFGERANFGPSDVCYRHRDKPTFTLCQRCGNNICPECQTQSAVGVLCPTCMKAARPSGSARLKRAGTRTGNILADSSAPVVTYGLMILCGIVFLGQWLTPSVTTTLWYIPAFSLPEYFEPWRMLTVMFTHSTGSLFHILGNMFTLWLFGRDLERALGRLNYLTLYLLAGWGGSLFVQLWVYVDPSGLLVPTVGASGAIFGVMGAMFVGLRAMRVNVTSLAVLLGINFAIGLQPGSNISWQAHLGGLLIGAAVMAVFVNNRGPRLRTRRIAMTVGIAAVLLVLSGAYWVMYPSVLG